MRWFFKRGYHNPIFINLVMIIVIVLGITSSTKLKKELFPPIEMDTIRVKIAMEETSTVDSVDKNIIEVVYPSLQGINGVKKIRSVATEKGGFFFIDTHNNANINKVKQDIKNALDATSNLPSKSKKPTVKILKHHKNALHIALFGNEFTQEELNAIGQEIKSEMIAENIASMISARPERKEEIQISLPIKTIEAKGLTLKEVAQQIKGNSSNTIAGKIESENSFIIIESENRKTTPEQFSTIPISLPNGEFIPLGELATVEKKFKNEVFVEFNNQPALILSIDKADHEDLTILSEKINEYISHKSFPTGLSIKVFNDTSKYVKERLWLIIKNGITGLILVLLVLSLCLDWRVAFWTSSGILFSLFGACALLYLLGDSINLLSLFGFLMASGIVVDDAIIIGEEFFHHHKKGNSGKESGKLTLQNVSKPVTAMLLTSLLAFIPLLFVEGMMGKFICVIPVVVIATLTLSLLESLFILPVHLAHHVNTTQRKGYSFIEKLLSPYIKLTQKLHPYIEKGFLFLKKQLLTKILKWALIHRYAVIIFYAALTLLLIGSIPAGWIKLSLFPSVDSNFYKAKIKFIEGTSASHTKTGTETLISALHSAAKEVEIKEGTHPLKHYHAITGSGGSHEGTVYIQLISSEEGRSLSGKTFTELWRSKIPILPEIKEIKFSTYKGGVHYSPILIELRSLNYKELEEAEKISKEFISMIKGVVDITSSEKKGPEIVNFTLTDTLGNLNISESSLSQTLYHILNGYKIDSFINNEKEIDVYVKGAEVDTKTLFQVNNYVLPNGLRIGQVAESSLNRNSIEIERENGQRLIKVYGNLTEKAEPLAREIRIKIKEELLTTLTNRFPNLTATLGGEEKEGNEAVTSLFNNYLPALLAIYLILATLFRSYFQPFIIMLAIPFCFIGAIIGHFFMGLPLNLMSLFGIIALSGIAINDSLILLDYINTLLKQKIPLKEALIQGAQRRFRPILLTSISTIVCLGPVLLETSFQAQFLIPMVTSLVFGLLFSTFFILLLIPIGIHIFSDIKKTLTKKTFF